MMEKISQVLQFRKILNEFPGNLKFCFAYGSGVFKQRNDPSENLLDLIFVVRNPYRWHRENIKLNPEHYAQPLRFLGHNTVAKLQESFGAKVYYNTLIKTINGRTIKYGVVSEISLVEDLLDWDVLYLAGRLHKPVEVIVEPYENTKLGLALTQNLKSAIHASLLLLPQHFNELEFYKTIASLSYIGDFRMIFGEDKNKIQNIVVPQLNNFRKLYAPILKGLESYIEFPESTDGKNICHQDISPESRIYHFHQLPRVPQMKLVRNWSQGSRSKDTEDCLIAIAYDPDSKEILNQVLKEIVWKSSVSQSLKGVLTAGLVKSVKYSREKIKKMFIINNTKKIILPYKNRNGSRFNKVPENTNNAVKTISEDKTFRK